MKSANCISATVRMPMIAAPVQPPTIAVSASGASITRHGPNSSWKPSVTLNAPPYTPTSSPMTYTRLSRRISVRSVEVLGCRIDALEQRLRLRQRRLFGALECLAEELLHARADVILLLVRELGVLAQPAAEALDRVGGGPAFEHLLRDVERVVV